MLPCRQMKQNKGSEIRAASSNNATASRIMQMIMEVNVRVCASLSCTTRAKSLGKP